MRRELWAVIVALLSAAIIAALSVAIVVVATGRLEFLPAIGIMFILYWPICVVIGGMFFYPLFWLAREFGWGRWWIAAIAGFMVGFGAPYMLAIREGIFHLALWFGAAGAVSGMTFWTIRRFMMSSRPSHIAASAD